MFRSLVVAKGRVPYDYEHYYTVGSHSFTVPANVFYISAVCVGGGGGGTGSQASLRGAGDGGDMVHATLPVTPGETLTVVVGDGGIRGEYRGNPGGHGESSGIKRGSTFILKAKGGQGGGNSSAQESNVIDADAIRSGENTGGAGGTNGPDGGGGAAGYSGSGGDGGSNYTQTDGLDGSGGGGGGGARNIYVNGIGGSGGGVYLFGEGTSGYGADSDQSSLTFLMGGHGSGDAGDSTVYQKDAAGAQPVGGGGGSATSANTGQAGRKGGPGGVRIVWPGESSFFPDTDVSDL